MSDLELITGAPVAVTVIMGELAGERSTAQVHSPIVAAQVQLRPGASASLPLDPEFEHAVMVLDGEAVVAGDVELMSGPLL